MLERTFPILEAWQRATAQVRTPLPGSDLAAADAAFPWSPASQTALVGLGSAREHLQVIQRLIEAHQLYTSAPYTLIRSALIGASFSVWALGPDSHEQRLARSLAITIESYSNHGTSTREAIELIPRDERLVDDPKEHLAHIEQRCAEATELRTTLHPTSDDRLELTGSVIPYAARSTFRDERMATETRLLWRSMSGAAHAYVWQMFGQPGASMENVRADGMATHIIGGDLERLTNAYLCAFHIATRGWQLFCVRSGLSPEVLFDP